MPLADGLVVLVIAVAAVLVLLITMCRHACV